MIPRAKISETRGIKFFFKTHFWEDSNLKIYQLRFQGNSRFVFHENDASDEKISFYIFLLVQIFSYRLFAPVQHGTSQIQASVIDKISNSFQRERFRSFLFTRGIILRVSRLTTSRGTPCIFSALASISGHFITVKRARHALSPNRIMAIRQRAVLPASIAIQIVAGSPMTVAADDAEKPPAAGSFRSSRSIRRSVKVYKYACTCNSRMAT